VEITDNANNSYVLSCLITVDTLSPNATQTMATYFTSVQTTDANSHIWLNGTASDLGVGLQSVLVIGNNVTGGSSWTNLGTLNSWAFYNTTPIPEPNPGQKYHIQVQITDLANNSFILDGYIAADFSGPQITPSSSTEEAQTGSTTWINGTASDAWVSVSDISIISSNITTPVSWTSNLGSNESWSFRNATNIIDGVWAVMIQALDSLNNVRNFTIVLTVDNTPPTITTLSSVVNGSSVTLSWLPVVDLTSVTYLIYHNGDYMTNTTSLYCHLGHLPDGQHNFTIRALDALGHLGAASVPITVQVGGSGGTPPDLFLTILIILVGAAIGLVAGAMAYRRGRGGILPVLPSKSPSWVSRAVGYNYKFEQKLLELSETPKKPQDLQDGELKLFLKRNFTALPGSVIAQLDQLPYSEPEKIEILQSLLLLPPQDRRQLLAELIEEQQEVAS
jgi:hypothetical protein